MWDIANWALTLFTIFAGPAAGAGVAELVGRTRAREFSGVTGFMVGAIATAAVLFCSAVLYSVIGMPGAWRWVFRP